jgi:V/A-type H+-transporting ATPase subunit A
MPVITRISGPVVHVALEGYTAGLYEIAYVGEMGLVAETVDVTREEAILQVFEASEGLRLGENVRFGGSMFSVKLGPGLLGSVFDGIQRPLKKLETTIGRGTSITALDPEKKWHFKPLKQEGDTISGGEYFGVVKEQNILHRLMLPPSQSGQIFSIVAEGTYGIDDILLKLDNGFSMGMTQETPLRIPRPFKARLTPEHPLLTGQRIIVARE